VTGTRNAQARLKEIGAAIEQIQYRVSSSKSKTAGDSGPPSNNQGKSE
jgi:hypothetical protein